LVTCLLAPLAWLWLQGGGLEVRLYTDEDRITLGDDLVLTVQATATGTLPVQISLPNIAGFEITGRSEHTEVSQLGTPSRTTTLELRLRALKPGRWELGPARAQQGTAIARAGPATVQVDEVPGAATVASNPVLKRLLDHAQPPPHPGQPAVSLVLSSDSAAVGEQVDVLTAAWFPRELRSQLRRPPTLQAPVIEGVWSYPQPAPPGIAATRSVAGVLYDLFVAHQIVFPLQPGHIEITPAILKYSVPIALQFFSQEERYTLQSASATLMVAPTPTAGRPGGFAGAVGSGLRLERIMDPPSARAGEPVAVTFRLSGDGNPALWPAPDIQWPPGVRAYPDRTDEHLATSSGRLGGTKTFRYTVVPDSSGPLALPAATYAYFDVEAHAFRSSALPADRLLVAEGPEATPSRPLPPPLLEPRGPGLAHILTSGMPGWVWALIAVVPPLLFLGRRWRRRRQPKRRKIAAADPRSAGTELEALVRELVPSPDALSQGSLVSALRTAGVDPALAARLVELRARLQEARYGPAGGTVPAELGAEARVAAASLSDGQRRRRYAAGGMLIALVAATSPARAQSLSPEWQYDHGALHGAIQAFAGRIATAPADAANWYDLGAAYYRLGLDGRAAAAWQQALRLAPRERSVVRALELVPPPESGSASRLWNPPVTWRELGLAAIPLWLLGWILMVVRSRRARELGVGFAGLAVLLTAATLFLRERERRPLGLLLGKTALQLSPHERAPSIAPLDPGTAVIVVRRTPGWAMVDVPGGRLGWVPVDSVAMLRGT
jgi:tetratricopeptide (TPR) repeat protein